MKEPELRESRELENIELRDRAGRDSREFEDCEVFDIVELCVRCILNGKVLVKDVR